MNKVDRRVTKTQEAIKNALIELMSENDLDQITMQAIADKANIGRRTIYLHFTDKYNLLDRLMEEHMVELMRICEASSDMDFKEANLIAFNYLNSNYSFFSTMLASEGVAPVFRMRFLEFVRKMLKWDVDTTQGINQGLSQEVVLNFFAVAIVGMMELHFTNSISEPVDVVAEQMGILLDRNF